MRTKLTLKQIRVPITHVRSALLKAKFDDLDNYLDAIGTTVYSAAGAINPQDGLAILSSNLALLAMTLADGSVVGEKITIVLRSGTSARITPATLVSGSEINLNASVPRVTLVWTAAGWGHSGHAAAEGELTSVAHGLATGAGPLYAASSIALPGGLVALTEYWWISLSANKGQLASSALNAAAGTAVNLTSAGSGTITLTRLVDITSVQNGADTLTKIAHGIPDEAKVQIEKTGAGVVPAGLAALTDYWAIVGVDPDTLKLGASLIDAQADTAINITSDGTLPLRIKQLAYKTITAVDFAT